VDARLSDELPASGAADAAAEERPRELSEVFDAHAAYVGRALSCLGVRQRELADAIQEVFLVVHRRLPELERPSAIRAWLYAICVRKAMSFRRRAARRREDAMAELPEPEGRASSPHDELERTRALAVALSILDELDDDKRAVVVLYEIEGFSMKEVAEILGCPLQTAYSRLHAARDRMTEQYRSKRAGGMAR
jgi:RNA polymerase sigma-70 factor (ECF subfamily)